MSKKITVSVAWHIIIISIFTIVLLFIAGGVFSYKIYKKIQATENIQKEILERQNKDQQLAEAKSKELIDSQQKALDEAKNELTKTKSEAEKTNAEIKTLSQTLKSQALAPKDIVISSSDLAPYVTGVVQVICSNNKGISSGSGSLWKFKELANAIVTNYHVVKDANRCVVSFTNTANEITGMFNLSGDILTFNKNTDEAIVAIGQALNNVKNVPIENYNYSLSNVRKCQNNLPVGSPVVVIGFPAYAKRDASLNIENIGTVNTIYRTVTNGIISGYDSSMPGNANYFVSAKIDNGNSGGMALAKDSEGICTLGLPTWLTVGNYETQGLVQNITNILPTN